MTINDIENKYAARAVWRRFMGTWVSFAVADRVPSDRHFRPLEDWTAAEINTVDAWIREIRDEPRAVSGPYNVEIPYGEDTVWISGPGTELLAQVRQPCSRETQLATAYMLAAAPELVRALEFVQQGWAAPRTPETLLEWERRAHWVVSYALALASPIKKLHPDPQNLEVWDGVDWQFADQTKMPREVAFQIAEKIAGGLAFTAKFHACDGHFYRWD